MVGHQIWLNLHSELLRWRDDMFAHRHVRSCPSARSRRWGLLCLPRLPVRRGQPQAPPPLLATNRRVRGGSVDRHQ